MRPPRFAGCSPDEAIARLGLRPSRARGALMRAYFTLPEPFEAVSLYRAATTESERVSVAATYRFIHALADRDAIEAVPTTMQRGLWRSADAARTTGRSPEH